MMSVLARAVLLVVVAAVLLTPSQGQIIPSFLAWGYCNEAAPQKGLDVAKFAGTWFTLERIPNQYVKTDTCVYANYTLNGAGGLDTVQFGKDKEGNDVAISSVIKKGGPGEPLTVVSEGVPEAPLKIIATDYETYACMESCLQYVAFKAEFAWILTKSPPDAKTAIQKCKEVFKTMKLDITEMNKIHQGSGCSYPDWAKLRRRA